MLKRPKFVLAISWKLLVRQLCAQQQNCVIFDDLSDDTPLRVCSLSSFLALHFTQDRGATLIMFY